VSGPNAEAASLGEDIPCAAGVRGDGPCSFELCPPGIGCRRVREQRRQGEGGAVLGEEARRSFLEGLVNTSGLRASHAEVVADEIWRRALPFFMHAVAQARADGAAEGLRRAADYFVQREGAGHVADALLMMAEGDPNPVVGIDRDTS
jgi:hypothetical protein